MDVLGLERCRVGAADMTQPTWIDTEGEFPMGIIRQVKNGAVPYAIRGSSWTAMIVRNRKPRFARAQVLQREVSVFSTWPAIAGHGEYQHHQRSVA